MRGSRGNEGEKGREWRKIVLAILLGGQCSSQATGQQARASHSIKEAERAHTVTIKQSH